MSETKFLLSMVHKYNPKQQSRQLQYTAKQSVITPLLKLSSTYNGKAEVVTFSPWKPHSPLS